MRNLEFKEDGEPGIVTVLSIFVASSVHAKLGEGRLLPYHLPGSITQKNINRLLVVSSTCHAHISGTMYNPTRALGIRVLHLVGYISLSLIPLVIFAPKEIGQGAVSRAFPVGAIGFTCKDAVYGQSRYDVMGVYISSLP